VALTIGRFFAYREANYPGEAFTTTPAWKGVIRVQFIDEEVQPAPFNTTTEEETERQERRRQYAAEAPPADWEDEWVDLGGEG
jgi:hypothetical protein